MTVSQRLLKCIGRDAMERLCREFGGEAVYVPSRLPDYERDTRVRQEFVENVQAGGTYMDSYAAVADEYGLTVRRVQQIVANMK